MMDRNVRIAKELVKLAKSIMNASNTDVANVTPGKLTFGFDSTFNSWSLYVEIDGVNNSMVGELNKLLSSCYKCIEEDNLKISRLFPETLTMTNPTVVRMNGANGLIVIKPMLWLGNGKDMLKNTLDVEKVNVEKFKNVLSSNFIEDKTDGVI